MAAFPRWGLLKPQAALQLPVQLPFVEGHLEDVPLKAGRGALVTGPGSQATGHPQGHGFLSRCEQNETRAFQRLLGSGRRCFGLVRSTGHWSPAGPSQWVPGVLVRGRGQQGPGGGAGRGSPLGPGPWPLAAGAGALPWGRLGRPGGAKAQRGGPAALGGPVLASSPSSLPWLLWGPRSRDVLAGCHCPLRNTYLYTCPCARRGRSTPNE